MSVKLDENIASLLIEVDVDFDQFDDFGESLAQLLDCRVVEKQWGADRHQWRLMFEGTGLSLDYEFYGGICWIKADTPDDFEVVSYLAGLLRNSLLKKQLDA